MLRENCCAACHYYGDSVWRKLIIMTLRDLVNSIDIGQVLGILQGFHGDSWSNATEEAYRGVIDELRQIPYEDGGWKSIVVEDDFDVYGLPAPTEDPNKDCVLTGLDFVDWSEFVEVPVESELGDDARTLAAILYEITFYGFSREAIQKKRTELIEALAEVKSEGCITVEEFLTSLEEDSEE